jgi:uncharacterized protein involved in exopolysaccharide biosynthesis
MTAHDRMLRTDLLPVALRDVALVAMRRKLLLAGAGLLPPVLAVVAIFALPPRYAASASVMVKTGREYLAREEGQVTVQSGPQTTKQEEVNSEIEIMTNRGSVETVIGRIGLGRLYPALLRSPPDQGTPMDAAVQQFGRRLKVEAVKVSDVIDVTFSHHDPALAAATLREFLHVYNERHAAVFDGGGSARVYRQAVANDIADLEALERQRSAITLRAGVYDAGEQRRTLIDRRSDIEEQTRQLLDRQRVLTERLAFLDRSAGSLPQTETSTETDHSDLAAPAGAALVDLQRQRSDLLARFAPEHPLVRSIDAQIASLRTTAAAAARAFVHVTRARSPVAESVAQDLINDRAELAPLDGQIARARAAAAAVTAQLRAIETGDSALRVLDSRIDSLSENLRETRTEFEKARALDEMDRLKALSVSVIQAPIVGGLPVFPNPLLFGAAGLVLGGLAASGMLILLVLVNDRVLSAAELQKRLGVPVLASFSLG